MNVFFLSTTRVGRDVIEQVHGGLPIAGVLGLSRRPATDAISGYQFCGDFCAERGIPFHPLETYDLRAEADRHACLELDIDVLVVAGWQRLVPEWLITRCRVAALGIHGSANGITGGRGRSPQNWALLLGKRAFHLSLFKIDAGIDSGDIVGSRSFELAPEDDIHTSYLKVTWCTAQLLRTTLAGCTGALPSVRQDPERAEYLPQRLPEDGALDWHLDARRIHDCVRAQTRPYPGAFSTLDGRSVRIWRTRPFAVPADAPGRPGEVLARFSGGALVVQTGDGLLLVEDYDSESDIGPGHVLESVDFREQLRGIVARHEQKHPDLPVARDLLDLL